MKSKQIAVLGIFILIFSFSCKKEKEQFASASQRVLESPNGKTRVAFLHKGEKVSMIPTQKEMTSPQWAKVRLSDGKIGYVKKKYLAQKVFIVASSSVNLKRRPDLTSPASSSTDKIHLASIAFVTNMKEVEGEGLWLEISGGYKGNYFKGWALQDSSLQEDLHVVQDAILLEKAIVAKDTEKLKELTARPPPVGEAASIFLENKESKSEEDAVDSETAQPSSDVDKDSEVGDGDTKDSQR